MKKKVLLLITGVFLVALVIVLINLDKIGMINVSSENNNELLHFSSFANVPLQIGPVNSTSYGMINGTFINNDGLQYVNTTGGFMNLYDSQGNYLRKVGFGITSDQFNRSVNDFSWEWDYLENETRFYNTENSSLPADDFNYSVTQDKHEWTATFTGGAGVWKQTYNFHPRNKLKLTH